MKTLNDLAKEGIDFKIEQPARTNESLLRRQVDYIGALNPFNIRLFSMLAVGKLKSIFAEVGKDEICGKNEAILYFQDAKSNSVAFCDFHLAESPDDLDLRTQTIEYAEHIGKKTLGLLKPHFPGQLVHRRYNLANIKIQDIIAKRGKESSKRICTGVADFTLTPVECFSGCQDYWEKIILPLARNPALYGRLMNELYNFKFELGASADTKDREKFYFFNYVWSNISSLETMLIEHKPELVLKAYKDAALPQGYSGQVNLQDIEGLAFLTYASLGSKREGFSFPFSSDIKII